MIDYKHLMLIDDIDLTGNWIPDRTSVGESKQLFGANLQHVFSDCGNGFYSVPFIQWRTFAPRIAFHEWKWMMNGMTDSKWLEDRKINIWKGNTSREFLDARGLQNLPEGDIGKAYGYQFRNFGEVDQIEKVFNSLRDNPFSRRHVVSLWNVPELEEGALEPCAFLYTFMVDVDEKGDKVLHLHMNMRSCDVIFGKPYNWAFASFWLLSFAKALGYKPGVLYDTMTNAHFYKNQQPIVDYLNEDEGSVLGYLHSCDNPKIRINKDLNTLDSVLELEYSDIEIEGWTQGPKLFTDIEMAI